MAERATPAARPGSAESQRLTAELHAKALP